MLEWLIDFSLRKRGLVVCCALILAGVGLWSASRLAVDAVPDITNPQIQINTEVAALAPEEIESLVTVPVEIEMAGLPDMVELRSLSKFGLSQITMTFKDGVDIYRLRQLVTERLNRARDRLPGAVTPALAPISTGLGRDCLLHAALRSGRTRSARRPHGTTAAASSASRLHHQAAASLHAGCGRSERHRWL
jgi:cobalt-zinc-cadmium resistance protein CzcA